MTATDRASRSAPERPPTQRPDGQLHRRRGRGEGVPRLRRECPALQLLRPGEAQADALRGRHRRGAAGPAALPVAGLDLRLRRRPDRLPAELDQAQGLGRGRARARARRRDRRRRQGPARGPRTAGTSSATPTRSGNRRSTGTTPTSSGSSTRTSRTRATRSRSSSGPATGSRFVERSVGAWMHVEHILGLYVFAANERSCPTNMHNTVLAVNSAHKIRFAQDLALYNLTLSEEIESFDGAAHVDAWNNDTEMAGRPRGHRGADRGRGRLGRGHVRHERRLRAADR